MSSPGPCPLARENQLLAAFPPAAAHRLFPQLVEGVLAHGLPLHAAGEPLECVYFPVDAVVSSVLAMATGASVEVCLTGSDGGVGIEVCLGTHTSLHDAVVHMPGRALRLHAATLRAECHLDESIQTLLLRQLRATTVQISHRAACAALHTIEQRLCSQLLMLHDRVRSDELPITHDDLAQMLGVRRQGISIFAGALKRRGYVRYARGHVAILDRVGLEGRACGCYGALSAELERLHTLEHPLSGFS
jgi:hypothetical protein